MKQARKTKDKLSQNFQNKLLKQFQDLDPVQIHKNKLDPRLIPILSNIKLAVPRRFASRDEILSSIKHPKVIQKHMLFQKTIDSLFETINHSFECLKVEEKSFLSCPDNNSVPVQVTRPKYKKDLPCVIYFHGGGMAQMSCFDTMYAAWAKHIAQHGVCVIMVDFRNALWPSKNPIVAPFPAGLNDCVSSVQWVLDNAKDLCIDTSKVILSGESGGGNLCIATALKMKQEKRLHLIQGIYALCPYLLGKWPLESCPSSKLYNGLFIDLHSNWGRMVYGIDAFNQKNPLAWPGFASSEDLKGLPEVYISVNELDPLCDEGVLFYRKLLEAGVKTRCRTVMGTIHAAEIFSIACPEISQETAHSIATFCKQR